MDTLVRDFGDAYPELKSSHDTVARVIQSEEERFDAVLANGLPRLEELLDQAAAGDRVVSGEAAFRLYDTHGMPRDFIEDMIDERKLTLDREGFDRAMAGQRDKARAKSKFGTPAAGEAAWQVRPGLSQLPDAFRGYDVTSLDTQIVELLDSKRQRGGTAERRAKTGSWRWQRHRSICSQAGRYRIVGRLITLHAEATRGRRGQGARGAASIPCRARGKGCAVLR